MAAEFRGGRLAELRALCLLIEYKRLRKHEVVKRLKEICEKEGIAYDQKALELIAERNEGDMRSSINDLQMLAQGRRRLTVEDVQILAYRDRKESIFDVLRLIFYSKTCRGAKMALARADVDYEMLFEWIYENAPYQLSDPEDLEAAMEALARADLYRARIRRTQDWGLLSYVLDLMTAGVAMSRKRTQKAWVKMQFPSRLKYLSQTKEVRELRQELSMRIRRRCHISARAANREVMPFLQAIFEGGDVRMAADIARWLELSEEMIAFLAGDAKRAKQIAKAAYGAAA